MAKNSADIIEFLVRVDKTDLNTLAQIRHFENLKMALSENDVWVSGFSMEQINGAEVKTLPKKDIFYVNNSKLFPKGSLLPTDKLPTSLLWTPIQKALLLEEPQLNHNFFGIHEHIDIQIAPFREEMQTYAILINLDDHTKSVIQSSPDFRLEHLKYVILNNSKLLVLGHPALAIRGQSFWLYDDFILPNGFHFKFPILSKSIKQTANPSGDHYVLWQKNNSYVLIKKTDFKPLSISSFRRTIRLLE
ncbi:hypothetical protein [uncultured Psychroserpens sp.]|uniref:hypothetical protein n=1 Tax=uncultured Psychroserpens sp. TaxID=255436 RepID=UPI00262A885B|nr:hypothetical protein [uncultured Psychroserpens sp.]